jgi:hypothetical protein
MAGRAWPGARSDGRPRMPRRGRARLTGSRRPDAGQYWKATDQHPQATDQHSQAGCKQPTSTRRQPRRHSRQPASTQGNRAALATIGPVLPGLGPEFVIFIFLLARRQAWAYRGREAAGRAVPAIAAQAITNTGGEPDGGSGRAQDAGIPPARTPEGGRLGLGREPLFAGNPRCTIAIWPSRQTGSRHHSGPITARG